MINTCILYSDENEPYAEALLSVLAEIYDTTAYTYEEMRDHAEPEGTILVMVIGDGEREGAGRQVIEEATSGGANYAIIPYLVGEYLPPKLRGSPYICTKQENLEDDIENIRFCTQFILKHESASRQKQDRKLNESLESYLKEVLSGLEKKERDNRRMAYAWYVLSVLLIAAAIGVAAGSSPVLVSGDIMQGVKSLLSYTFVIALVLMLARLCFILGKSFIVESIRNGDRIHAISFGKFFIQAYGSEASRDEIRAVFGEWNIDKGSSFQQQDVKDIDPKLSDALQVLAGALKK